jgi:hypothetical protein
MKVLRQPEREFQVEKMVNTNISLISGKESYKIRSLSLNTCNLPKGERKYSSMNQN